jgi:hypothetical protein
MLLPLAPHAHQNFIAAIDAQRAEAASKAAAGSGDSSGGGGVDIGGLLARALYVQELTRREPGWSEWQESASNMNISPEVSKGGGMPGMLDAQGAHATCNLCPPALTPPPFQRHSWLTSHTRGIAAAAQALVAQLQARPDLAVLSALSQVLVGCTPAYLDLFTQLGGLNLLAAALEQLVGAYCAQQQAAAAAEAGAALPSSASAGNLSTLSAGRGGGGGGERPAAADSLSCAVDCVKVLLERHDSWSLLLRREPRWVGLVSLVVLVVAAAVVGCGCGTPVLTQPQRCVAVAAALAGAAGCWTCCAAAWPVMSQNSARCH